MRHSITDVKDGYGTCSVCGHVDVKRRDATTDRYRCGNARRDAYRNRDWKRNALRAGHNVGELEERRTLLENGGYACAICGTELNIRTARIDHDHETGVIRGTLCNSCNLGLGLFQDNPELLSNAAKYLGLTKPTQAC
ncbi:hypothetical protein SEA_KENREY_232 [Streptomyces phage Kenrey]|nr:hypothetical protein SEA_KENREY_232 [Streptomyces phage Kenrey]